MMSRPALPALAALLSMALVRPASAREQEAPAPADAPAPAAPAAAESPTPAASAAPAAPAALEAKPRLTVATVELASEQRELEFFWRTPGGQTRPLALVTPAIGRSRIVVSQPERFEWLCTERCRAGLPPGTHELGIALDDKEGPDFTQAVTISGDSRVQASYVSRMPYRMAGYIIAAAGAILGLAVGLQTEQSCTVVTAANGIDMFPDCKSHYPNGTKGLIIGVGFAAAATPLFFLRDKAEVRVEPARR